MIKMIKEEESLIITKKFIQCNDVVKIYVSGPNSVTALRGITFKFQGGNTYVIFGPSGAGKSTFLSIIGGLDLPSSGTINFNNQFSINNESIDLFDFRIKNISFIFQEPIFIPFLTVTENLKFFAKKRSERLKEKIDDVLGKTNLLKRKKAYPYQLSGGEKQRLSIAIALFLNNNIWLCDEPTGTLDSENKTQIINLLKQIISNDPSKILIIVTHDPLFQKIADKILILRDGIFELEMNREEFEKFSRKTVMYETLDKDLEDTIQKQSILKKLEEIKRDLTKE